MGDDKTYADLSAAVSSMKDRLDAAVAQDKKEADSFWVNFGQVFDDGLNYFKRKREFDEQVATLTDRAYGAYDDVKAAVEDGFSGHAGVADDLDASWALWLDRATKANTQIGDLKQLQALDGWTGQASQEYGKSVGVQIEAMKELVGIMTAAAEGASQGAKLNRTLMTAAHMAVEDYAAKADVDRPGGSGMYYNRTANWGDYLVMLPSVLNQIASAAPVEGPISTLNQQLREALQTPALLKQGSWPEGTSAAGVPAADTGGVVPSADEVYVPVDVPSSTTPGVCTAGASR